MTELHHRLTNWARWAREHHGSIGHCASIEHRYRSPQHWWPEEPRMEVDLADALTVERAVRSMPLSFQKPFVVYWVEFRAKRANGDIPAEIIGMMTKILIKRYKLPINRYRLGSTLNDAQNIVSNLLTRAEKGRISNSDNSRMTDGGSDTATSGVALTLRNASELSLA